MCCYDDLFGFLVTDTVEAGYPFVFNLFPITTVFERIDKTPYENCCRRSSNCQLYRQYRPLDDGSEYQPPVVGTSLTSVADSPRSLPSVTAHQTVWLSKSTQIILNVRSSHFVPGEIYIKRCSSILDCMPNLHPGFPTP